MGTNFYFRNKDLENSKKYAKLEISSILEKYGLEYMTDKIEDIFDVEHDYIHIAKTSVGWKPLFQSCDKFSSVQGLKEFYSVSPEYEIIDEYEQVYDWRQFNVRVLKHCKDGKSHINLGLNVTVGENGFEWREGDFS